MIGFYSYTVILTYLSLVFAMVGIHLSVIGLYQWSFICLMMCGICDTFDGMVARSKKRSLEFKQILYVILFLLVFFQQYQDIIQDYLQQDGLLLKYFMYQQQLFVQLILMLLKKQDSNKQQKKESIIKVYQLQLQPLFYLLHLL